MSTGYTQGNPSDDESYCFTPDENRSENLMLTTWARHGDNNRALWGDYEATTDSSNSGNNSIKVEEIGATAGKSKIAAIVERSLNYKVNFGSYNRKLADIFDIIENPPAQNKQHLDADKEFVKKYPPYKAVGSKMPWNPKASYEDYLNQQPQGTSPRRNQLKMEKKSEKDPSMHEIEQLLYEAVSGRCDSPYETMLDCETCDF